MVRFHSRISVRINIETIKKVACKLQAHRKTHEELLALLLIHWLPADISTKNLVAMSAGNPHGLMYQPLGSVWLYSSSESVVCKKQENKSYFQFYSEKNDDLSNVFFSGIVDISGFKRKKPSVKPLSNDKKSRENNVMYLIPHDHVKTQ